MHDLLSAWLSGGQSEGRPRLPLLVRVIGYGVAGLLSIAALGFLMTALHGTYLRLTDDVTAPLLVAATLAVAVLLILLVMMALRTNAGSQRERRDERHDESDRLIALIGQMSQTIADGKLSPLAVVGLALTTGLMQGLRK